MEAAHGGLEGLPVIEAEPVVTVGDAAVASPWLLTVAWLLAAALLLLGSGFVFGSGADLYHLPYVLGLHRLPQFADDPFFQGLRRLPSWVWPIERLFATEQNVWALFFLSYAAALTGLAWGLLHIVVRLSPTDAPGILLAAVLIGGSALGAGDALPTGVAITGGFTAGLVAAALGTIALALALDGALLPAVALLGLILDAKAGLALCTLAALLGATPALASEQVAVRRAWVRGGVVALVLGAPGTVSFALGIGRGFPGNYQAFLEQLRPESWLIWTVPLGRLVLFAATLVMGVSAFAVIGPAARALRGAFLGLMGVFWLGCLMPFMTGAPWLLNLMPLAADRFLVMLAIAAAVAVVVRDLRGGVGAGRAALTVATVGGLVFSPDGLPVAALALLARAALAHGELLAVTRLVPIWRGTPFGRATLVAVLLLSTIAIAVRGIGATGSPRADPDVAALVAWARAETAPASVFLVRGATGEPFEGFQMLSRRRAWLGDRRGASILWDPGAYPTWQERTERLAAATSGSDRLALACRSGVDYVADQAEPDFDPDAPDLARYVAFRAGRSFVVDAKRYCAAG
jgi:hypothetical protein